jgi:hypothetical protein
MLKEEMRPELERPLEQLHAVEFEFELEEVTAAVNAQGEKEWVSLVGDAELSAHRVAVEW